MKIGERVVVSELKEFIDWQQRRHCEKKRHELYVLHATLPSNSAGPTPTIIIDIGRQEA